MYSLSPRSLTTMSSPRALDRLNAASKVTPVNLSVASRFIVVAMDPVPSSMTILILRSGTGSTVPWVLQSLLIMVRLHSGHLLMIPLPGLMSTTTPLTMTSSPPPFFTMSPIVLSLPCPTLDVSIAMSTADTSALSPMLIWGIPFHELT